MRWVGAGASKSEWEIPSVPAAAPALRDTPQPQSAELRSAQVVAVLAEFGGGRLFQRLSARCHRRLTDAAAAAVRR